MIVVPKGTVFHTITSDPDYSVGLLHYVSFLPEDIKQYQEKFPLEIRDREGNTPVYEVLTVSEKDLKILEHSEAKVIFDRIYAKNSRFRIQLGLVLRTFLDTFQYLDRPLNGRELLVHELLANVCNGDVRHIYDAFEVAFELDNWIFDYPFKTFISAAKRKGYDGIVDTADLRYGTYDVKAPAVIFNSQKLRLL